MSPGWSPGRLWRAIQVLGMSRRGARAKALAPRGITLPWDRSVLRDQPVAEDVRRVERVLHTRDPIDRDRDLRELDIGNRRRVLCTDLLDLRERLLTFGVVR